METKGVVNGVTGLVSQQPYALGLGSPLDLEDLGSFEALQSRVGEVEGNRDARNAIRREPFLREPAMGSDA